MVGWVAWFGRYEIPRGVQPLQDRRPGEGQPPRPSPLKLAILSHARGCSESADVIRLLLRARANLVVQEFEEYLLFYALCVTSYCRAPPNRPAIVRGLIEGQADVNRSDEDSITPLMKCESLDCLRVLMDHRADVRRIGGVPCKTGRPPAPDKTVPTRPGERHDECFRYLACT